MILETFQGGGGGGGAQQTSTRLREARLFSDL